MADAGMLLVRMEPPAAMEDEFHEWYDREHVPEREALPGFLTAARYISLEGWPRYMACYDLGGLDVLEGEPYRQIGGENLSPWSKRVLSHVVGYERLELEQRHPEEDAVITPAGGKVMIRFSAQDADAAVRGVEALAADVPGAHVRVFDNALPAGQTTVMIDAPTLTLIPDWQPGELREKFGAMTDSMLGLWRYTKYERWI